MTNLSLMQVISQLLMADPSFLNAPRASAELWKSVNEAMERAAEAEAGAAGAVRFEQEYELRRVELFAWLGKDELGSGAMGIKQGLVPAGYIPLVSIERAKIEKLWPQLEKQAKQWGNRISLCRFRCVDVVRETVEGK